MLPDRRIAEELQHRPWLADWARFQVPDSPFTRSNRQVYGSLLKYHNQNS